MSLFVTKKEVSTHYVAKGITITCKITMGLIDLLHKNTYQREPKSMKWDNISHNWKTKSQGGLEVLWD